MLELAVEARLLDVGRLVLVRDAQDLRSQARRGRTSSRRRRRCPRMPPSCDGNRVRAATGSPLLNLNVCVQKLEALRHGMVAAGSAGFGAIELETGARHLAGDAERRLAAARDAVIGQAARLGIVEVEVESEVFADVPVGIEADRLQIVLLLAMLLLVAEVLAGAGELVQQRPASPPPRRCRTRCSRSHCAAARSSARRDLP